MAACVGQEFLPGLGDTDLFAHALVELRSEFLLQLHLHGNGRLGVTQRFCSLGETLGLSYFGKCNQVSNFHEILSNIGINEAYFKYFKIFDMTIVAHMEENTSISAGKF